MDGGLLTALLDLCFPPRCVACALGVERVYLDALGLCPGCRRGLGGPVERCLACARQVGPEPVRRLGRAEARQTCERCAGPHAEEDALATPRHASAPSRRAIRGVVAAWTYGGVPRDLVVALKFHARTAAARPLALALAEALRHAEVPGDLVVHVPLSALRRRQRGYDQAGLLARHVARTLGVERSRRALRRRRHTAPQSGLSRSARRRAPRGAFVARPSRVAGRCVILIDDVLTSGATAKACALALRRAGALSVTVAVACRAERGRG